MEQKVIHMNFRDVVSVSLLLAAFEKSFPHFLNSSDKEVVDVGGKGEGEKVFHALREFSTSFPHGFVDEKTQ